MSRRQIKLENKKKKRQLKLFLFFILLFMIIGILSVDYALREMLALEDAGVFSYERQQNYFILYFLGEKIYIENEKIEKIQVLMEGVYDDLKENVYHIIEKIKDVGITDIFFKIQYGYLPTAKIL